MIANHVRFSCGVAISSITVYRFFYETNRLASWLYSTRKDEGSLAPVQWLNPADGEKRAFNS